MIIPTPGEPSWLSLRNYRFLCWWLNRSLLLLRVGLRRFQFSVLVNSPVDSSAHKSSTVVRK